MFRASFFGIVLVLDQTKVLLRQYRATMGPPPLSLCIGTMRSVFGTVGGPCSAAYGCVKYFILLAFLVVFFISSTSSQWLVAKSFKIVI